MKKNVCLVNFESPHTNIFLINITCFVSSNVVLQEFSHIFHIIYLSYCSTTTTEGIFKKIKDKTIQKEIKDATNKLILLKDKDDKFNDSSLNVIRRIKNIYENNLFYMKRPHVLNNLTQHLVDNEMQIPWRQAALIISELVV